MTKLLKVTPESSTGWRTEALLVATALLIIGGLDAVAQKYGFTALQGTAAELTKIGFLMLAALTARARADKAAQ